MQTYGWPVITAKITITVQSMHTTLFIDVC